jgi:hypothetical protein
MNKNKTFAKITLSGQSNLGGRYLAYVLIYFYFREVKHNGHICPQHLATKAGSNFLANFLQN